MIVTIDPGTKASGVAVWSDFGKLMQLAYVTDPTDFVLELVGADDEVTILVEAQQIYRGSPINPNTLLDVAYASGRLVTLLEVQCNRLLRTVIIKRVLPRKWKGNMKKAEMLKLIVSKLYTEELKCLRSKKLAKSKEKELVDALGIGLWFFGRI